MNIKRRIRFCSIYFFGYIILALIYGQYIPYLKQLGYSATDRGIMISTYSITTILFQLLFGYLSDKYNKAKEVIIVSIVLASFSTLFLFTIQTKMFILHFLLIGLSGGLVNTNFGLFDTWLYTNGEDTVKNFSFIRAFGSFGWAVASILSAKIVSQFGYFKFGIVILFFSILTLSLIGLCQKNTYDQNRKNELISILDIKNLLKSRPYILLLIIMIFLSCVTTTSSSVIVDKLIILGATNQEIGLKWAINGAVEIPLYLFGTKLLEKMGANKLLILASITISIQYLCYAISSIVFAVLVVSAGQMFTGPFLMLSSRMLFKKYAPKQLQSTSILLGLSIYQGISMLIMPAVGGYLTDHVHVNATLYLVVVFGIIAIILSILLNKLTVRLNLDNQL